MHDFRYHLTFPGTLATCFSFRNVSFPFLSSPSYAVFHSEAKFYIVGYEFYISERGPSKMFLFQRLASLWQLGQTGRHSPLWTLSWTDPLAVTKPAFCFTAVENEAGSPEHSPLSWPEPAPDSGFISEAHTCVSSFPPADRDHSGRCMSYFPAYCFLFSIY